VVEDWWLLRKPLACPTVAAQVLATGTGALNVDGCRVGIDDGEREIIDSRSGADRGGRAIYGAGIVRAEGERFKSHAAGRWPANLVHDGSPEVLEAFAAFGAKDSTRANGNPNDTIRPDQSGYFREREDGARLNDANIAPTYRDTGTAARFFYSAKASKAERAGSKHPTVKPVALMRWLCRLVTPPGGVVLDPFAGSGTTGEAARLEGFGAVLIEREAEHVADIRRRLGRAAGADTPALGDGRMTSYAVSRQRPRTARGRGRGRDQRRPGRRHQRRRREHRCDRARRDSLAVPGFSDLASVTAACVAAQTAAQNAALSASQSAADSAASAAGVGASAASRRRPGPA
jgi:hypothetical protein